MSFAVLGLLANFADVDIFLEPLVGRSATHPVTAICLFGLAQGVFVMRRYQPSPLTRRLRAAAIAVICFARVLDELADGEISALIFGDQLAWVNGRFSLEAALAIGAFAIAAILRMSAPRVGLFFLAAGLAVVFNALLEMLYGLTFFNGDVGPFTLLGLLSLAAAMVTVYVHRPFVRVWFLVGEIGTQTRILALTTVCVPIFCGIEVYHVDWANGVPDAAFAIAISVIVCATLIVLMTSSARHEKSDAARRRGERKIAEMSRTDALTGALNRFGMAEVLEKAWQRFEASDVQYGLILVDLDHFKTINDTFGHEAGDDVLTRVTSAVRPHLRANDVVGRWGGEEFLVLIEVQCRTNIEIVAERLRVALEGLESPYLAEGAGRQSAVSASFGVSDFREEDGGYCDAINRADEGLYIAKEKGRNRVVPFYLRQVA